MEGGLLRLLIFSCNETHLQHSCPKGKNRSKSDWQLKATKSCLQFKLLSDRIGRLYVLAVGGRCKLLVCIQMWETWRHGTDRTTMHGDKHMLAWLAEAMTHAVQPGKWTKSKFDRCKDTDKQRRGRAHPPLPNSRVSYNSMHHTYLKPSRRIAIVDHNPQHYRQVPPQTASLLHDERACKSRTTQKIYPQIHFQLWVLCKTYL